MANFLRLQQIRQFMIVAESGSFRTAAADTFRSQAAVSAAMRDLEQQVGGKLFEPGRRSVLTQLARDLRPLFNELLMVHNRVLSDARGLAQAQLGSISLAVVPFLSEEWLPTILTEFAVRYPKVQLTAIDDLSHQICTLVLEGRVDIGVVGRAPADPKLKFEPIAVDAYGVLCSRKHRFAKSRRPLHWAALRDEYLIGNDSLPVLRHAGLGDWVEKPHMILTSRLSLMECVRANVGVTILPLLSQPSQMKGLAFVPLVRPHLPRTIGIVTRQGRTLLPAAAQMQDILTKSLKRYAKERGARIVQSMWVGSS